ncbi:MAG TPA: hypothetical protein VHK88_11040, partial [Aquihabitans sp.]|nr:hypothetical protein [Aquihabitans sp.]
MTPHRSTGEWSLAVRQQASVARIGQLGLRGGELHRLLDEALLAVADTLGVQGVALFELLPGWHELRGRAAVLGGGVVPPELVERVRLPAGSGSLPGFTVESGVAVVTSDLHHDERFRALAGDYGITARS